MSFGERPQDYPRYTDRPADQQQYGPQQPVQQYGHQQQYGAYPVQPGFPDQPAFGVLRDNSNATIALVLGLLAFVTALLILSPFAWWKGSQALAEIDAAPGVYNNRGMAVGGQICGIIGTVLLGLVVLFFAVLLIFFIAA
ncbi:hypothetical protein FB561_6343 [Kribbella amoyensis]|uniref:DUF4190 domain-containing protein n=1 Tax=Kribbella amoyensis TaxID=996641 RepID=A0A561B819_9ACTN|nr:DUF4190 domain-containing protein [Kribbella amoyensis]TWD74908.1 hypothetical protein FB561_6343 [Kribbella amoyensis]